MDVLDLFLDDDEGLPVTARSTQQAPKTDDVDFKDVLDLLLIEEFKSDDTEAQRDALAALLQLRK